MRRSGGWAGVIGDGTDTHAVIWTGTAASMVDVNPSGFTFSEALATNGSVQVGYGSSTGGNYHALLWTGTAASGIDLNAVLPATFTTSEATAVDSNGNVFGYAVDSSGAYHVIESMRCLSLPHWRGSS